MRFIVVIMLSFFCISIHARSLIVVDAGSSGTRLHVYKASAGAVTQVAKVSTEPGLSFFVNSVSQSIDGAGLRANIGSLLTHASQSVSISHVTPIYFYATGGLRLLSTDVQNQLLAVIKQVMQKRGFTNVSTKIISGQDEALYDWIGVNAQRLMRRTQRDPQGVIDMGGASLEIAFSVPELLPIHRPHIVTLRLPSGEHYYVYARSFLGLGQTQAIQAIVNEAPASRQVCFPRGADSSIQRQSFNWQRCHAVVARVFSERFKALSVEPSWRYAPTHFVGLSGLYYVNKFFQPAPLWSHWHQRTQSVCASSLSGLQQSYPQEKPKYLKLNCMASVYQYYTLANWLQMQHKRLRFDRGDGWPDGVAIVHAIGIHISKS